MHVLVQPIKTKRAKAQSKIRINGTLEPHHHHHHSNDIDGVVVLLTDSNNVCVGNRGSLASLLSGRAVK